MKEQIIQELSNKKIVILGFGREGKSTYNFIKNNKIPCDITIADKQELQDKEELENCGIKVISGDNYLDNLSEYDLIIKTPGISLKDIDTEKIKNKITSQTELFIKHMGDNTIGITGTKGKSTTASLIYEMLKKKYKTVLFGNIGLPAFNMIEEYPDCDWYVYELSSHQLEFVKHSPKIAILLNMFEDHLDHYKSYGAYKEAKRNIFKFQTVDDWYIYNYDMKEILNEDKNIISNMIGVSENNENAEGNTYYTENEIVVNVKNEINNMDISMCTNIIGKHNKYNMAVAATVAKILDVTDSDIIDAAKTFESLPHRMQNIGVYNDITYIDDSIATIPEAVIAAVNSNKDIDTVLIGGMDRGIDYDILVNFLKQGKIHNVILMYDSGRRIFDELIKYEIDANIIYKPTLEQAVEQAVKITNKFKTCLLSPAAASYGVFKNFEERGNKFKEYVIKYSKN